MKAKFLLLAAALSFGLLVSPPGTAEAGGGFSVGFGTSSCFGPGCYRPYPYYGFSQRYYRPWGWRPYGYYRPYYPPPRIIYRSAPPVVVEQAPPPAEPYASDPALAYDTSYCREYSRTATVDGQPVEVYGTACLQPDGSWRIVD
jgi:hypothetical protein